MINFYQPAFHRLMTFTVFYFLFPATITKFIISPPGFEIEAPIKVKQLSPLIKTPSNKSANTLDTVELKNSNWYRTVIKNIQRNEYKNREENDLTSTTDPLGSTADWTAESNQDGAVSGKVASAGDVNGDGYSDVIVGAYLFDNGENNEGKAFLYYGSATGLSTTANWTIEGNRAGALLGTSVSTAGDVNGDGYSDIIIGADGYSNNEPGEGRALVYYGSANGLSAAADWMAEGNQSLAHFGCSVSFAGDINGDGYSDVIIGAYQFSNGQQYEGAAFIYLGSAAGLSQTVDRVLESNQALSNLGRSVASAGDVNSDGYSDIIISAHNFDNGQVDEGTVFVYYGSGAGISAFPDWTAESDQAGAQFGFSVGCAGDVNGDGYSDIVVGSIRYDNGETDEGIAFVYHGSSNGLVGASGQTIEIDQADALFGYSVATAGDINGDGYSDVIIGAFQYESAQIDEGSVQVYFGSAMGLSTKSDWFAEGDQDNAHFGFCVASAGDVNGDGYSDVMIGAYGFANGQINEGAAFVYAGSADASSLTSNWIAEVSQPNARFGHSVASAGDVNSDGYSDVIIGSPYFDNGQTDEGRVFVFYGSINGLSVVPDWIAEIDQADARFGHSVASAGDVNGDGFGDIIVGAFAFDNGQTDEGAAFIYYGSAGGLTGTHNWFGESNQGGAHYGISVASAGDVNGDGYSDVIVGADYFKDSWGDIAGKAFVYHGSATGVATASDWTAMSIRFSHFGRAVASAGDINGDGYSDIIVGAWNYTGPESSEGAAFVFHGSATGLAATSNWMDEGNQVGVDFGWSVAAAGDVNGDGFGDIIVGAMHYTGKNQLEGKAYLYYGSASGLSTTPGWTAVGDVYGAEYGYSVSAAGDVNGDGYSDIIVGAYLYNFPTYPWKGAAFLYLGSPNGPPSRSDWTIEGAERFASLGFCVASGGDVNGDGYSDVIIAANSSYGNTPNYEKVFMHYGNAEANQRNNLKLYNTDRVTPINHSNISGSQFAAGFFAKSPLGRAKGRLIWEVKKEGIPFSNIPITNSTGYTGRQTGLIDMGITGTELKTLIDKAGRETKIRVRVEYDKATALTGQVYGPWRYNAAYQQGVHGMGSVVLPLRLLHFSGVLVQNQPRLQWTTADELNILYFELERSTDGMEFNPIATLPAKGNDSGSHNSYDFTDVYPVNGKLFYRLKIKEEAGHFTYSPIVSFNTTREDNWEITPNPVTKDQPVYLTFSTSSPKQIAINLVDTKGTVILRKKISLQKGIQVINLGNLSTKGIYIISVTGLTERLEKSKMLLVN